MEPLPRLRLDSTEPISGAWLDRFPQRQPAPAAKLGNAIVIPNDSLLCVCPECGAPMSMRMWLLLADCWRCGASLEMASLADQAPRVASPRPVHSAASGMRPSAAGPAKLRAKRTHGHVDPADPRQRPGVDRRVPARRSPRVPTAPVPPPRPTTAIRVLRRAAHGWRGLLRVAPAWLVSLLLHLVLLTLLGLFSLPPELAVQGIRLSTAISPRIAPGGRVQLESSDEPQFDLPVPETDRPLNEAQRKALLLADQDARQIRLDPSAADPYLPPLAQVRRAIGADDARRTLAVRDPRVRVDLVRQEGGTTWTEASVARGLRWMAQHQREDGSWSLHRFHRSADCRGRCRGAGQVTSDSAATSLCLLPFLGAGQTHLTGSYRDVVARGLRWLIEQQQPDGDLRIDSRGNTGMYAQGQGAIVLCEAYGMTGDQLLREPAQAAIDFIVAAQHSGGGWRYHPGQEGDTSVLGWQLMALQSARVAGLHVPPESFAAADHYLDSALTADGVSYAYRPGEGPSHVMTAEALLCRMYLGWNLEEAGMRQGLDRLVQRHPPLRADPNVYYWYYATQALHHAGGHAWEQWNLQLRDVLVQSQEKTGHAAGSWTPRGPHADAGGRLYMTALAVCTLEVYYRHAPIFRRINLMGLQ